MTPHTQDTTTPYCHLWWTIDGCTDCVFTLTAMDQDTLTVTFSHIECLQDSTSSSQQPAPRHAPPKSLHQNQELLQDFFTENLQKIVTLRSHHHHPSSPQPQTHPTHHLQCTLLKRSLPSSSEVSASLSPAPSTHTPCSFALQPLKEHGQKGRVMESLRTQLRKWQHIHLCLNADVEHSHRGTGFDAWTFSPTAIPTICPSEVSTEVVFCGRKFAAPFFITPMTGGIAIGEDLNQHMAEVCHNLNLPMGVGSQRLALEDPSLQTIFQVKKRFPQLFVIGNMGISHLTHSHYLSDFLKLCHMIPVDVMSIHVNVLQELIQPEGQRTFPHLWQRLETCIKQSPVPVMIKEVGCGVDVATARRCADIGVQILDVGGAGGTSWAFIEGQRRRHPQGLELGHIFRDWGIPTAQALAALREHSLPLTITATGGIRNGLQGAKAIALGAHMVGLGLPVLKAAFKDLITPTHHAPSTALRTCLETFIQALRLTLALTSSPTPYDLPSKLAPHPGSSSPSSSAFSPPSPSDSSSSPPSPSSS